MQLFIAVVFGEGDLKYRSGKAFPAGKKFIERDNKRAIVVAPDRIAQEGNVRPNSWNPPG